MVTCKRCGFKNPEEFFFCGNCGFKLSEKVPSISSPLSALAYLHMVGGAYLILSIILLWGAFIEVSLFLFVGGFLNLYIGWRLYNKKVPRMAWVISLTATTFGLLYTFQWFIFIPDWMIFIMIAVALWQSLPALKEASIKR
ncbi:MAG: zinc ribbon domain-containing protein [Candidatus Methylarchaceae archaeon HK01M]|nr:zinc ribbon domain-containing protein [Candidatus Methylarchaceae archaeon HK01M]